MIHFTMEKILDFGLFKSCFHWKLENLLHSPSWLLEIEPTYHAALQTENKLEETFGGDLPME